MKYGTYRPRIYIILHTSTYHKGLYPECLKIGTLEFFCTRYRAFWIQSFMLGRSKRAASMNARVIQAIQQGSGPTYDGWGWLYRTFDRLAPPGSALRSVLCAYYTPTRLETVGRGCIYRWLGVPKFGRIVPTGGINIRRATGARMAPYTLSGPSIRAARDFYYRACVFETLHLPFFLTLAALASHRFLIGRVDWAIQETVINLAVNFYPMLHHRNTRRRILALLSRHQRQIKKQNSVPVSLTSG